MIDVTYGIGKARFVGHVNKSKYGERFLQGICWRSVGLAALQRILSTVLGSLSIVRDTCNIDLINGNHDFLSREERLVYDLAYLVN